MKRMLAVLLIGTFATLLLGIEDTSWAVQSSAVNPAATQSDPVTRALSTLRRGATVEIERTNGTTFYAVIEEIGPDAVRVMRDQSGTTLSETIAVTDIRSIRAVTARKIAHSHKVLIISAVVAGLIVVGLVGACRSASNPDVHPIPNGI